VYKNRRLVVARPDPSRDATFSVAFLEPGLVAVGSTTVVRSAIDLAGGGPNVTSNGQIMNLVRELDTGNVWAVGRFDALASQGRLPSQLTSQLPPISWFSASGSVDTGVRGTVRVDANDEGSANNLRETVRGFVALAKLQTAMRPEWRPVVDSLNITGTGNT